MLTVPQFTSPVAYFWELAEKPPEMSPPEMAAARRGPPTPVAATAIPPMTRPAPIRKSRERIRSLGGPPVADRIGDVMHECADGVGDVVCECADGVGEECQLVVGNGVGAEGVGEGEGVVVGVVVGVVGP